MHKLTNLYSTGIIGAVAEDFFNIEITMEIVKQLEELERTGKKEHVVFLVTQRPVAAAAAAAAGPVSPRIQSAQPRTNGHNAVLLSKEVRSTTTNLLSAVSKTM